MGLSWPWGCCGRCGHGSVVVGVAMGLSWSCAGRFVMVGVAFEEV